MRVTQDRESRAASEISDIRRRLIPVRLPFCTPFLFLEIPSRVTPCLSPWLRQPVPKLCHAVLLLGVVHTGCSGATRAFQNLGREWWRGGQCEARPQQHCLVRYRGGGAEGLRSACTSSASAQRIRPFPTLQKHYEGVWSLGLAAPSLVRSSEISLRC